MNILVLGVGQSMRGDDAAGLKAVRLWQDRYPDSASRVLVILSEQPGLDLLDLLDDMDSAIIVDALRVTAVPGSLYHLGPDDLAAFLMDSQSSHGWGLAETLSLGRHLYPALSKCHLTLLGIVGGQFILGADLSPAVLAGVNEAVKLIEKDVKVLLGN